MTMHRCAVCGKRIAAAHGRKYCSETCKKEAALQRKEDKPVAKLPDKPCEVCGTLFSPRNSDNKYCCAACRREAVRQSYDKYRKKERQKMKAVKPPPKPRTPPAVSLEEVCRFQAEYRRLHGVWLGYHQTVEKMREMGYPA